MIWSTISNNLHDWIAIFIAVLALLITIWNIRQTRLHNRMSTRPIISFHVDFEICSLTINNGGPGTAIILPANIYYNGKFVSNNKYINFSKFDDVINFNSEKDYIIRTGDHYVLKSNATSKFFEIKNPHIQNGHK